MDTPYLEILLEEYRRHPSVLRREAWGEFVSRWPWEWFVTLTFSEDVHEERGYKLFRVWISKLNRELFGPRWHLKAPFGVYWVLAFEQQKSGRLHLHALVAGVGDTRRLSWMDRWSALDQAAGIPRIFPVENLEGVSRYVTKYVAKEGNVEFSRNLYDISRDLVALASDPGTGPSVAR